MPSQALATLPLSYIFIRYFELFHHLKPARTHLWMAANTDFESLLCIPVIYKSRIDAAYHHIESSPESCELGTRIISSTDEETKAPRENVTCREKETWAGSSRAGWDWIPAKQNKTIHLLPLNPGMLTFKGE